MKPAGQFSNILMKSPMSALKPRIWTHIFISAALSILLVTQFRRSYISFVKHRSEHQSALAARDLIIESAQAYVEHELPSSAFGETGFRAQELTRWFEVSTRLEQYLSRKEADKLTSILEQAAASTFPFLRRPGPGKDPISFVDLFNRPGSKSRGIVVTTGRKHLRYTMHLIANIRLVLKSSLPIQVVYAGDKDLSINERDILTSYFSNVETLDILNVFDDTALDLRNGGWAIKPFALLASKFEQTILVDADTVFLQDPETIFETHQGFKERGALLFHDRLLWKDVFRDRAAWWRQEMGNRVPSDTLQKSKVWMEGYAEEGDSGVIVFDKSRPAVFMALLHICWQNTVAVRNEYTYRMTYGDKESWWFGLELCGTPFVFEDHYASILGEVMIRNGEQQVCSFTIAHTDEEDELLWFNGSLLRNKLVNHTDFLVPTAWATDGEWVKGATKLDMSCMRRTGIHELDEVTQATIILSIKAAKAAEAFALERGLDLVALSS